MIKPVLTVSAAAALITATTACGRQQTSSSTSMSAPAARTAHGRIRGVVRLDGPVPQPRLEPTGKDVDVCGSTVPVTRLALGNARGVARTFVYL
jgi:hypothetical protein